MLEKFPIDTIRAQYKWLFDVCFHSVHTRLLTDDRAMNVGQQMLPQSMTVAVTRYECPIGDIESALY
jgi:hypothetical protein